MYANFPDLKDASVFITGGGSGIGASLTDGFLAQGAKVAFVQRSDASAFCDEMEKKHGQRPVFLSCDITDMTALKGAIDKAAEAHGPITVLVNNAANDKRHASEDVDEEFWDWSQAINLKAYFFACQHVIAGMRAAGGGSIVNFTSISYMMGNAGYAAYTTANSGINGMTRSLAREFGPDRIRVNAIAPGWVLTQKQKDMWVTPEGLAAHIDRQCLKEELAPEDMVDPVLFLASKASKAMTGQALVVDGGCRGDGMTSESEIAWIAADWGTTNLRIWALDPAGSTLAHRHSDKGMGKLARTEFEPALLDLIEDLLPEEGVLPVIVCGMAGSRQGWAEAPYKTAPCAPPSILDATAVKAADPRLDVRILPGIKQMAPPDVMRGEETQIAGFLADHAGFSGTICLPGTHTKWVSLNDGRVDRFQTFMTGESFALFSGQSVLRHGLSANALDETAFRQAVRLVAETPQLFAAELFGVRAAGLIAGLTPEEASGRLSGLLIGAELAAIRNAFNLDNTVLLGSDRIATSYQNALACLGHEARLVDAEAITLRGLTLAYSEFSKGST